MAALYNLASALDSHSGSTAFLHNQARMCVPYLAAGGEGAIGGLQRPKVMLFVVMLLKGVHREPARVMGGNSGSSSQAPQGRTAKVPGGQMAAGPIGVGF